MLKLFRRLREDCRAASAVEYGMIVALVVIAMVASLAGLANVTTGMWNNVNANVSRAMGG